MERKCATVITVFLSFIFSMPLMGKSMQLEEPFYKAYFKSDGIVFGLVVNGVEVYFNKSGNPVSVEIPINQFVRTGENKLELQMHTYEENDKLYLREDAKITVEYRLYTSLEEYVVLNKLNYSAKNAKAEKPFEGSSEANRYSLIDHKFVKDDGGDYNVSEMTHFVDKEEYGANYISHTVSMPTPFPEWNFLASDKIPSVEQFKSADELIEKFVGAPYAVLEEVHAGLSKKDVDSIIPLFKERNDEMDKAFYYKPGTYEKMLRDAFQEEFDKNMILEELDIEYAGPTVSPGSNLVQLGTGPLIRFHNKEKSVFNKYDIFFRKQGDQWIITR